MMTHALMMVSPLAIYDHFIHGGAGNAFVRPNNDGSLDYIPSGAVSTQADQWLKFRKAGIGADYQVMMQTVSGTEIDWVGNLRDVWLSMGIFPSWGINGNPSGPNTGRLHFRRGGSGQSIASGLISFQVP